MLRRDGRNGQRPNHETHQGRHLAVAGTQAPEAQEHTANLPDEVKTTAARNKRSDEWRCGPITVLFEVQTHPVLGGMARPIKIVSSPFQVSSAMEDRPRSMR